ncbi:hypothetical protein CAMRE0001_1185 [Campylobacter rectus RM3267]|uniref:Major outer membrane protein n=2 Tax=Campylobacter rectus TaxID=203 RepID=A0A6G5QKY6_CAMRE|nr:porin [Campylobacter rectus]EEF14469.1 hypothetical protein CAMRE0001_1185 [Campylobacter rectus RM3267]QCD46330.1 major outer membrane protein [Campylobacter rectus]UEB47031.1 porin [Campylobacter rectus]
MKLAKISLAALVALGAFSTLNATPLEEAIKDVDFSGFARYRYTGNKLNVNDKKETKANHNFRFVGTFKAALDDNFFGVLGLRYAASDGSGYNNDFTNTTSSFGVREFYLGYKAGNTTVTAGKQFAGTYFEGDLVATGLRVQNTDVSGLTLVGVAFDALETDKIDYDGKLLSGVAGSRTLNYYGLGAMGSYDPVNFKAWWAYLEDTANLFAADVALKFDFDAVKLGLQGQYVHNESKDDDNYGDANFFATKGNVGFFGVNLNAGYIHYKAKENKLSFVTVEDNGKLINPAKLLNSVMNGSAQYYNNIKDKNDYWFIGAAYKFDKFGLFANYIDGKGYSWARKKRIDRDEWNIGGNYAYSKKLNFSTFYAATKEKDGDYKNKHDRIRFEAKYSF